MHEVPHAVAAQAEDGDWLGTCDWGYCGRETAGWALSADGDWLTICAPCSRGDFSPINREPIEVQAFVRLPAEDEEFRAPVRHNDEWRALSGLLLEDSNHAEEGR